MNIAIKNNVSNVFNTKRLCVLTGNIKPLGQLKATPREAQLHAQNKAEREKLVLSDNYNQINITTQAASDESRRKAGRHIRG